MAHATDKTFDYVIVGGGTAGLVLANRLSARPNVCLAVIEPGGDERTNADVTDSAAYMRAFNTAVDWNYVCVPQVHASGRILQYHVGKAIGGTSTINGMTYMRAQKAQIDSWEAVGNTGWNWDSLLPYYKKAERFIVPTPAQAASGGSFDPLAHGTTGPVSVGFPDPLTDAGFFAAARDAWAHLGQAHNHDPNGGDVHGFSVWPLTCVPDSSLRADAAQAYYWPVAGRPNLLLVQGTATRILWAEGATATACGVEYVTADGEIRELLAAKEVILSAGAFRTPALLELSGVGNPTILAQHGITTKVALPAVGENLQDQPGVVLGYHGTVPRTGLSPYAALPTLAELLGTESSARVRAQLPAWAADIAAASGGAIPAPVAQKHLELQHTLLFERSVPAGEVLVGAYGASLGSALWPLLPFSRGSVHIASSDPLAAPTIDPRFFAVPFDAEVALAVVRLARRFWATPPIADLVERATRPDVQTLAPDASDEELMAWMMQSFGPNNHQLGSAAMMARELGGVLDPTLRVYDTTNVRVVDASALPMQLSGHLSATIYALAERAADIILEGGAAVEGGGQDS